MVSEEIGNKSPMRQTKSKKTGRLTQSCLKKSKTKMSTEQSMMQVIMQPVTEAAKAAITAGRAADNPVNNARPIYTVPRSGSPTQRKLIFDSQAANKY